MSADLPSTRETLDALVVGGGPAGLSAATWLGRYRRSTAVVDAGHQRNLPADHAHGLLGRDPTTAHQLLAEARAGLDQYPEVMLCHGTVTDLRRAEDGRFHARIDGTEVRAERVVLATGVTDRIPQVAGFHDHYGTDVFHCLACDGFTARDQEVIVLGSGDQVPAYAAELLDWTDTVRIIAEGAGQDAGEGAGQDAGEDAGRTTSRAISDEQRAVLGDHGIEVVDGVPAALIGAPGSLTGVQLTDGELVRGDKVFFSYGHDPSHDLARQLGCELDHEGRVVVNDFQLTSVDGVYAAGDLTPGLQLIPIAIGKGTAAGVACATSLRGHRSNGATPDPAPPTRRFTGA